MSTTTVNSTTITPLGGSDFPRQIPSGGVPSPVLDPDDLSFLLAPRETASHRFRDAFLWAQRGSRGQPGITYTAEMDGYSVSYLVFASGAEEVRILRRTEET